MTYGSDNYVNFAPLMAMPHRRASTDQLHIDMFVFIFDMQGNEGVQVKEGTLDTIIEDNEIYLQLDRNSGGVCARMYL